MTDHMPTDWGGRVTISRQNLSRELWRSFPGEWKSVYRYQGLPALLRCLSGTHRLLRTSPISEGNVSSLDLLSCSVIPEIASLWGAFISRALKDRESHLLLADSSGNLNVESALALRVLPLFNFNHGVKLDLLMHHACQAEYVLICDDDIFWLNDEPLKWALEQFEKDSQLAVISLHPRPNNNQWLEGVVPEAMGSYCLVIRREIWLRENLYFQPYKPPDWKKVGNYFDTADYANFFLVEREYKVLSAPISVRAHLVPFYGTSMWGLKILASKGDINRVVYAHRPDERKKAYRTALALLGFRELLSQLEMKDLKPLVPADYLHRTLEEASKALDQQTKEAMDEDIQSKLTLLSKRLLT